MTRDETRMKRINPGSGLIRLFIRGESAPSAFLPLFRDAQRDQFAREVRLLPVHPTNLRWWQFPFDQPVVFVSSGGPYRVHAVVKLVAACRIPAGIGTDY